MRMMHPLMAALLLAAAGAVHAKVSPEEASRLGRDLTPLGGEKTGTQDGSIPAWDGGWLSHFSPSNVTKVATK